jgi:hypothetical protein
MCLRVMGVRLQNQNAASGRPLFFSDSGKDKFLFVCFDSGQFEVRLNAEVLMSGSSRQLDAGIRFFSERVAQARCGSVAGRSAASRQ